MKNKLFDKIKKLCPDILELKFGCFIDVGQGTPHYVIVIRELESNRYTYNQHTERKYGGVQKIVEYADNFTVERTPIKEIKEIIGSPITLSVCLRAILNMPKKDSEWREENCIKLMRGWLLPDDNLASQESETIKFLSSILLK